MINSEKEKAREDSTEKTDEIDQLRIQHKVEIQQIEKMKSLEDKYSSYVPKSDLDDLMLLMSDLDDKNKAYKSHLRKLGETIESDESSDDDEEEDGDDDNEEED